MTRKQLIIDAALQLFAEKGIEATSVQQITDRCGISKGAFYLSFKSKDELVFSIIEHFMNNIIDKVDQAVNQVSDPNQKLQIYFVQTFSILSQYTSFAEILMREKVSAISEDLIERIQFYIALSNKNLEKLLFDVFGDQIKGKQYDLVLVVNGMVQAYLQWICEASKEFDINKLAQSLVEKTTILATQTKLVFLEHPISSNAHVENYSNEKIIEELEQLKEASLCCIEKESVQLLIEELQNEEPRTAIILGLLANLEKNDSFSWITLFLKQKFSK